MQLLEALDEERELGLESRTGLTLIKRAEEVVVLGLVDELAMQALGDHAGQGALADADRTFDCDVAGWFEEIRHVTETKPEDIVSWLGMQLRE
jgi:hypothetical protein